MPKYIFYTHTRTQRYQKSLVSYEKGSNGLFVESVNQFPSICFLRKSRRLLVQQIFSSNKFKTVTFLYNLFTVLRNLNLVLIHGAQNLSVVVIHDLVWLK